jgi:sterol carrier protein 2
VYKYGLQNQAIEIAGMSMKTDFASTFEEKSMMKCVGYDMTKSASQAAYAEAGVTPKDIQVIELHDCFSANELITYEALGLCAPGGAGALIDAGDNTYGGKWVVNPSGGLISKGHPLGATGLAQCAELCWQLRGQANKRQVKNVTHALQHNLGLGGAAVVTIYRRPKLSAVGASGLSSGASSSIGRAPREPYNPDNEAKEAAPAAAASGSSEPVDNSPTGQVFAKIKASLNATLVKKIKATFRFDIGTKSWFVDLKNGAGAVNVADKKKKADCSIAMSEANFTKLVAGKANPQQLFMSGKLKLKGNMMLAQKLDVIFKAAAKADAAAPKAAAAAAAPASSGLAAEAVFAELSKRIDASMVKKVKASFRFNVSKGSVKKSWFVNLKSGAGGISSEAKTKADCTITMKDGDFVALMSGKLNPMQALTQGKVKISGNMMLAQKLSALTKSAKSKL